MSQNPNLVVVFAVAMALLISTSNGQNLCNVPISGLMACRPAITQPNPSPPSAGCCAALSHADLACLCSYKNSSLLPSFGIDPDLALQLPAKCKLPRLPNC